MSKIQGCTPVVLPTLHADQVSAFQAFRKHRFFAVRAGRRWGKTELAKTIAADLIIKGYPVGWFAPDYKISAEAFTELANVLEPVLKNSSKVEGVQRTVTGGRADFWTLDNERAGRSRKYKLVVIDEAAFTADNMIEIWERSIKPTLLDFKGRALVVSNTNGVKTENFLWRICNQPEHEFGQYHAPTSANPYMPQDEIARLKTKTHPLVWAQEYEAEFVDWSGVAFFGLDKLLDAELPVQYPSVCDGVYAVIDTAVKAGSANDCTAVTYFATSKNLGVGFPVVVLDYDALQIEGAVLEHWLPSVYARCEELARMCRARHGSLGAFIEDAAAGSVLLQQAARHGWQATPLSGPLLSAGKDGRALNISGYVHQGMVKFSEYAYNKIITVKDVSKNHLVSQVLGFRLGDKDAARRADDLLDTFTWGVSIALGNQQGF